MTAVHPRRRALRRAAVAVLVPTLLAPGAPAGAAEPTPPRAPAAAAELPSGRTAYRTFADYDADLARLAADHPTKTRRFTLAHPSLEGRPVHAMEISRDVAASDHKPVLLMTGVHHAREWPSSEVTIEFAFDLLRNDGTDPRITALLDRVRVVVVPLVNPDGFRISREMAFEMKRRNCRLRDGRTPAPGACAESGNRNYGVDLNRNYGAAWTGGGSATSDTYPGAAPFSEPESRNVRDLVLSRQVAVLISNHTQGSVVLHPVNPEATAYRGLADKLAAENGYSAGAGMNVGGMTERWSYYATGGFGFTVEIGKNSFHPPFPTGVVEQYVGAGGRRGLRSMYLVAGEAAADRGGHAVLTGRAVPGAVLRITKDFDLATGAGKPIPTHLESALTVGPTGSFAWEVNPSTRASGGTLLDEKWTLTCARPGGPVVETVQVLVRRGQEVAVELPACRARGFDRLPPGHPGSSRGAAPAPPGGRARPGDAGSGMAAPTQGGFR
ncbi:hypothetical protein GCM10010123_38410 [Pilimelia anulata]|uniref:Peptidase M14 domain-containing protein n=1 Tax=Pilimelia anulata TaxID=53371 RepID=A0A8J3FC71_9ACTN|nr:M14 family zinc carboxypeptidase [Pilimelia anulata]GGK04765.1 hypothetical protein GCM10010123_38410 [Pilimelia anulata]